MTNIETIKAGEVSLGKLRTWPNVDGVRFNYVDGDGKPMEADFDTRRAFDIWIAAMCAGTYRATFPTLTENQARRLAVAYHGYNAALDCSTTISWGDILLAIQKETGIELVQNWMLQSAVRSARTSLTKIAAAVEA